MSADGHYTVTTHIFNPDDPHIHSDAVFGVKESQLGKFVQVDDAERAKELGLENPYWDVEFNITLAGEN